MEGTWRRQPQRWLKAAKGRWSGVDPLKPKTPKKQLNNYNYNYNDITFYNIIEPKALALAAEQSSSSSSNSSSSSSSGSSSGGAQRLTEALYEHTATPCQGTLFSLEASAQQSAPAVSTNRAYHDFPITNTVNPTASFFFLRHIPRSNRGSRKGQGLTGKGYAK